MKNKTDDLWAQVETLAGSILNKMVADGLILRHEVTEDLRQEAILAGGEAIPRWSPDLGSFATFATPRITGAALSARTKERRRGVTGSWEMPQHVNLQDRSDNRQEYRSLDELLAVATSPGPEEDAASWQLRERVILAVMSLRSGRERSAVCRVYGIQCDPEGAAGYAAAIGVHRDTVQVWLDSAKKALAVKLADVYKAEA